MERYRNKAVVIIPTYNEIENIKLMIEAIFALEDEFHIMVVDDASPDGTAEEVKKLQVIYGDALHLEQRSGKLGLGTAYIHGFRKGLSLGYTYLMEMDADFSHDPKDLIRLLKPVADGVADMTVGSRYTRGGGVENWPFDRRFLSYGASVYVRLISWMPVKDPTAGFICYHQKVLESLKLDAIKLKGYGFQIEMKYAAYLNDFRIIEVPITFKDRILGVSKMNSNIITEAILGVLKMKWKGITGYYLRK